MWELVEEIERPRIVSARVAPFQTKENLFGQVIVRLHTRQVYISVCYNTLEGQVSIAVQKFWEAGGVNPNLRE